MHSIFLSNLKLVNNFGNSSRQFSNTFQLDQSSLGLLSREYFLEEKHKSYKDAYKTYFTKVAILLGADPDTAKSDGEQVINFETALANVWKMFPNNKNC